MNVLDYIKTHLLVLDGGMGTLLQSAGLPTGELPERWNLTHPEVVEGVHRAYFEAGAQMVCTNTFGANRLKFTLEELDDVVRSAVENARRASRGLDGERYVALDVGPTGKLLAPLGDLDFEDAVQIFAETVKLGVKYGVDLIFIETMSDCYETKAALLAAKENCSLPVFVSNAYGADCRLMSGATPAAMVAMLEGMGADAIGANCSLGPQQLSAVVDELLEYATVPVLLKPNAGLPSVRDGRTVYDVSAETFGAQMGAYAARGVRIVGGCCGTTPEYIRATVQALPKAPVIRASKARTLVSSYTHAVDFADAPILIGERINPTGKKLLKAALLDGNIDYLLEQGLREAQAGAAVLDVNVGLPGIDESEMLVRVVGALQAVCDLPLQMDSADPLAMEAAWRRYNGKPLINSVSGKAESMARIFPLVKKYGGVVVALTLDDAGIPDSAEGRVDVARRILKVAESYGIDKKNLVFDTLTMAVCAEPNAAKITLQALQTIRSELGCNTVLGVSNVSFGLPNRDILNAAFFSKALERGLSAAIMNPHSAEMMKVYYAHRALCGADVGFGEYMRRAAELAPSDATSRTDTARAASEVQTLRDAIERGMTDRARELARGLLDHTAPLDIVKKQIVPALDTVGRGFEEKTLYLPSLLMAAEAAKAAFVPIREKLSVSPSKQTWLCVVMATVKGDIHDIGKNIVCLLLENYGFTVVDLGRDVAPEKIVEAAMENGAAIIGLSALMTTTVGAMQDTIRLVRKRIPSCRVIVGGAVLTADYAERIGADHYAPDAMEAVRYAERVERELAERV